MNLQKPLRFVKENRVSDVDFDVYDKIFDRLEDEEFHEERFQLYLNKIRSVEDPYMISELHEDSKYELLYALSGMHYLFELVLIMRRKKVFPNKNVIKYIRVCEGLINYLYGYEQ